MQLLGISGLLFTDYRFRQGLQIKNIDNNLLFQIRHLIAGRAGGVRTYIFN